MLLMDIQSFSDEADEKIKADLAGQADRAAWVFDGATPLTERQVTDTKYDSDAQWFVHKLNDALQDRITDRDRTLREAIADSLRVVRGQFRDHSDTTDRAAYPSATAAVTRWSEQYVEYYVICDARMVVVDDQTFQIYPAANNDLDERSRRVQQRIADKKGVSEKEARQARAFREHLRDQRRQQNTPDGHWVLGLDPEATFNGAQGRFKRSGQSVLLMSDGFDVAVEDYDLFESWRTVVHRWDEQSGDELLRQLRQYENDNAIKQDDSTCVYLRPV